MALGKPHHSRQIDLGIRPGQVMCRPGANQPVERFVVLACNQQCRSPLERGGPDQRIQPDRIILVQINYAQHRAARDEPRCGITCAIGQNRRAPRSVERTGKRVTPGISDQEHRSCRGFGR